MGPDGYSSFSAIGTSPDRCHAIADGRVREAGELSLVRLGHDRDVCPRGES